MGEQYLLSSKPVREFLQKHLRSAQFTSLRHDKESRKDQVMRSNDVRYGIELCDQIGDNSGSIGITEECFIMRMN